MNTYEEAVEVAGSLWGDTPNEGAASEYLRGMAELLGDLYPEPGITLDERAASIATAIIVEGETDAGVNLCAYCGDHKAQHVYGRDGTSCACGRCTAYSLIDWKAAAEGSEA